MHGPRASEQHRIRFRKGHRPSRIRFQHGIQRLNLFSDGIVLVGQVLGMPLQELPILLNLALDIDRVAIEPVELEEGACCCEKVAQLQSDTLVQIAFAVPMLHRATSAHDLAGDLQDLTTFSTSLLSPGHVRDPRLKLPSPGVLKSFMCHLPLSNTGCSRSATTASSCKERSLRSDIFSILSDVELAVKLAMSSNPLSNGGTGMRNRP